MKRILVGCEYSGTVRDEFAALGWDAWSCDLLPSEKPGNHIQCDIMKMLTEPFCGDDWDIILLHPPCTAMGLCGNRHYGTNKPLHGLRVLALDWTEKLVRAARARSGAVAIEQPGTVLCQKLGKRTQEIQPYQFGHPEQKKTWLWLYGLPPLKPTKDVYDEMMLLPKKERERIFFMSPSASRGHERSLTYSGIAKAMAAQWTEALKTPALPPSLPQDASETGG